MKKFIKDNLVLIAGIGLPVALVIGFLLMAQVPRAMVDPAAYDFIVVGYRYDHQNRRNFYLGFEVSGEKLRARVTPNDDSSTYHNQQYAAIYRYIAKENRFEEIIYDLPEGVEDLEKSTTFPVQGTRSLRLDKRAESPDGFRFEFLGYGGSGGLLGEIFGMRRRNNQNYVLNKNGVYLDLPNPGAHPRYYYSGNLVFMGWVIAEDAAP